MLAACAGVSIASRGGAAPTPPAPEPEAGAEASRVTVDLNVGKPSLGTDTFVVALDGGLGYATPRFGVAGSGGFSVYDLSADGSETETVRDAGQIEGWWTFGEAGAGLRPELRVALGAALYSATYVPAPGRGTYHDEDSLLRRGTALAGLRLRQGRLEGGVWVGGGVQHETFDYVGNDPADALVRSEEATTMRGEARLRLRYAAWPSSLALRLTVDATRFSLTRSELVVARSGAAARTEAFAQTEIGARLAADLEILALFGFVPAAFLGLDDVAMSGEAGARRSTIPVVGLGVSRRDPF